ncbi:hypothetical protein RJ639_007603 [Escallonia herrerae]|uniref:VQ domain-containing protein n=1 Tax=Escallonia herrerae TaxID=1293975 RepID=A0AA88VYK1_9ASTE|nr:hypothetical protein RJ639_007603 [Escallonia herrerae]
MEKSWHSSTEPTDTSSSNGTSSRDQYLKHLNKFSHKISKPPIRKPSFDNHPNHPPPAPPQNPQQQQQQQQQQQHQPPVYNINKSDFRDVVQKLTGSPAHHERYSTPTPINPPKPQSSRLQRIRPPPLAQLISRPTPAPSGAAPHQPCAAAANVNPDGQRQLQPLSPLPPFPAVHAAAESPISAYMRYLQASNPALDSDPKRFPGVSPRWSNLSQPPPPPPPQSSSGSTAALQFPMPSSPLPFGCLPSPRSPYPSLFSPGNQFGFSQFPLSPTLQVPSPKWKGV